MPAGCDISFISFVDVYPLRISNITALEKFGVISLKFSGILARLTLIFSF